MTLLRVLALLPNPSPEPTATPTDSTAKEILGPDMCGTGDLTVCGVLNNVTGDIELSRTLSVVIGTPLFVLAVILGAIVLRYILLRVIRRAVRRIGEGGTARRRLDIFESLDPISAERRVQRSQAIGSILKAVVSVVVWSAAVLLVLPALGADITGLVASAGIIGIALGFGAQTLVQDFVSGIFMIAEDQYGVGDVIDMGEASGVVESVGLRTTRLRSVDGTVWHVRNGEVLRVGNMSQGWSRALLDVGVGYGADVTRVMEVLKEIGLTMRADPDYGAKFLDDPEVWGVEALSDNAVTIRMIIKTVPLEQWVVAREMRRRIKHEFDRLGIEIPFPQRTVWIRTDGPGGEHAPSPVDAPTGAATRPAAAPDPVSAAKGTVAAPPPRVDPPRGERDVAHEDGPAPDDLRNEPGTPAAERPT